MLLYQRFEIPDEWDRLTGRPALARDVSLDRDVFVYSGAVDPRSKETTVSLATKIRDEAVQNGPLDPDMIETFTAGSSLWMVTPRNREFDHLVEALRQAGVLPNPLITVRQVTPPLGRCAH